MKVVLSIVIVTFLFVAFESCQPTKPEIGWPATTRETKPWTRWWWHGSAVTKEGITAEMEAYQRAGLGGLEITPIYGVHGYEEKFVDYLSPQWMELFLHTLKEAERLDLGIDMATGTGWPFGGPWVNDEDACRNLNYKVYEVKGGASVSEKIEFIQQPYLRAVGNQVYEVHQSFSTEKLNTIGTTKEPLMNIDPKSIDIKQLVQPVSANKNLQALALDQVIFERSIPLQVLMAYNENGVILNLTDSVDQTGKLNWIAPDGNWKLYAVFEGWHGKMVERAGPGGEGNVIDHFSKESLRHYLHRFDSAFAGKDIRSLRAFFNDSYEVDDARGAADWTSTLFDEFKLRRGYDLREHLPALLGHNADERNKRVLSDYRETISEMVLSNFTRPWKEWAHTKSAIVRNQAHGAPSNILDLYTTIDIPEIEGVEPLRIKMASSAGNVTGKRLVSSESATWLNEHFESNLAEIKVALDRFMLNGVNHIFYHGASYSPPNEPWPGWLFYAAVHLNPRNSQWRDFDALNKYVERCQSFLQNSTPDNDVLLYYPIYDRFAVRGPEMIEHFDGIGKQFENTAFKRAAEDMLSAGYSFDYISDKQIGNIILESNRLKTEGGSYYKTIVIPKCQYIPLRTFQKIILLAESGATVLAPEGLPVSVAGYFSWEENEKLFHELLNNIDDGTVEDKVRRELKIGKGRIVIGDNINDLLGSISVRKESMVSNGIQFIRKKGRSDRIIYMITNSNREPFDGWLPFQAKAKSVVVYNPMNGEFGKGMFRINSSEGSEVYLHLNPEQALIIELYPEDVNHTPFKQYTSAGESVPLTGAWKVSFVDGGPVLPHAIEIDTVEFWTDIVGEEFQEFSGTARYTIKFKKPSIESAAWSFDLGEVKESAEVFINGKSVGTLLGPDFQIVVDNGLLQENNVLEIVVSNLMANRIAAMDRKQIFWRKFYNVNFPARKPENRKNGLFSAIDWATKPSGVKGPVKITPVRLQQNLNGGF